MSTSPAVPPSAPISLLRRAISSLVNLGIVALCAWAAEIYAVSQNPATRNEVAIAAGIAFAGLTTLFWAFCGFARRSPGMIITGMYVVRNDAPERRAPLVPCLLRSVPYLLLGLVISFPAAAIDPEYIPMRLIATLVIAMILSGNASTLWSGDDRRTWLDKHFGLRVTRAPKN